MSRTCSLPALTHPTPPTPSPTPQVRIEEGSPAIMLQGMGGAQIGVWCAHGEGQAIFPSDEVRQRVMADTLAPIR